MSLFVIYKTYFAEVISTYFHIPLETVIDLIEIPPEHISWDFAFPCFQLAKTLKKSPQDIAITATQELYSEYFSTFEAIGGYINAHIHPQRFIQDIYTQTSHFTTQPTHQTILIEYMNANPNKPLHIGQWRNVCIWDALRRIYQACWYEVHTCNYGDDSGVNVWYNIVAHLFYDYPLETTYKFDHYCGKIYEEMRKKDEDPIFKRRLSETLQHIEQADDPDLMRLHFDYTRRCTLEQLRTCRRMQAYFDFIVRETDILHLRFFAEAIDVLKQKWAITYQESWDAQWCWIIDLSGLPEYQKEEKQYQILIKSDGVATYIGKDIAFAMWKIGYLQKQFGYTIFEHDPRWHTVYSTTSNLEKHHHTHHFWNYDQAITIIDNRQIPAQTIVRSALTILWWEEAKKRYIPLWYGVVYLTPATLLKLWYHLTEEEKAQKRLPFSSRKWRTVTLDEMLKMLHDKAYFETKARNPEKDDTRLDDVAEAIAIGSLRFFLVKSDIEKDLIFDVDEVLDMQGETWAYILYTWARIQSILDSCEPFTHLEPTRVAELLTLPEEFALIKKLAEFPTILQQAQQQHAPHLISRFLLDLAKWVNNYYAHVHIKHSQNEVKYARIMLLERVRDTLQQAMDILGMKFLSRM